jgi:DNA-binding response OmpR family regulator
MVRKPSILVVDDDEPILILMKNILREFQFDAIVASSGADALHKASAEKPDLVLVDMNMPEMSGAEFISRLRAAESRVPVLILSGDPVTPDELEQVGADGAIQKPFDLMALIEQIRHHLSETPQTVRK